MPRTKIINAVVRAVRSLPNYPSLRILDLSCGEGQIIETLSADGCTVEGTHYRSNDYILKSPTSFLETAVIHKGVDLAKPLPLPDGQYDVVLATEVLEHLPSHILVCSEAARILKINGHFIFSTPNIHRLHSRLLFMLTGEHELRGARLGWETSPSDLYSTHYNPVYFPVIHAILHHNHLYIERLIYSESKFMAYVLMLLYPLIWTATIIHSRHALKRSYIGGRNLLRWMLDLRMLISDQLIVVGKKH